MRATLSPLFCAMLLTSLLSPRALGEEPTANQVPEQPLYSRHVQAVLSRLGCNGGGCHGAVQGQNGFRLSLFGAQPAADHASIVRDVQGRRVDLLAPEHSLLLKKASGQVAHGGGRLAPVGSLDYEILRRWLVSGAPLDQGEGLRVTSLQLSPAEQVLKPGEAYTLRVMATFADAASEDVTALCGYQSLDPHTAEVDRSGRITAKNIGDVTILVRYRDEPATAMALVANPAAKSAPSITPVNFIDEQVLRKLARLGIAPAELADDATFLRRVRLDVTGQLPTPDEVRAFLKDKSADKRARKIDELLKDPGYSALWTLKFCDLLGAADFGVYADGLFEHHEAPRFQAWVRARLEENVPYDEFAARILLATSRDGRSLEEWAKELEALQLGYQTPRQDLELYAKRQTLDAYWQRKDAIGVPGALQVAHTFLGLRLQCAQCHRHPHDVWQQDDLLSFANFFMGVRRVGFEGDNEKKYAEQAALFKQYEKQGKELGEEVKKLKEGAAKELAEKAKAAKEAHNKLKDEIQRNESQAKEKDQQAANKRAAADRLPGDKAEEAAKLRAEADELVKAAQVLRDANDVKQKERKPHLAILTENDTLQEELRQKERRGKLWGEEVAKRILHAEITSQVSKQPAQVTSPLGTQTSKTFRLLGQRENVEIAAGEDPRAVVVKWLRDKDNPFFARAIVNRVWAHYFDRGLIDPPDDLSPFNPASHPQLLKQLADEFIAHGYDLKWLHRTILSSRTYQQSSALTVENQADRVNYSHFPRRRLPAEVLIDAVNEATGTREDFGMKSAHWRDDLKTVEIPYAPQNTFVAFALEQFGRSERNSSSQCDCQRTSEASMLQVLSLANHPRVGQKIAAAEGRVAQLVKEVKEPAAQIEALYLATVSRLPDEKEQAACRQYLTAAPSPAEGLQGVLWSLLNTREFLLQH